MISGVVNEWLEAVVSLQLHGPNGVSQTIDTIVDTGYSRNLTVSPQLVADLALPFVTTARAQLADGSVIVHSVYSATVIWDGQALLLELDEADTTPLVGMSMLDGHDLHIEIRSGGHVTIERRP